MEQSQDSNEVLELSDKEDKIISNYVDETSNEDEVAGVYVDGSKSKDSSNETLVPTFSVSSPYPFVVGPKGQSRINLSKGKRPRLSTSTISMLDSIDGDMLMGLDTSKVNNLKLLYKLARESQHSEKIKRATHTLMLRIDEMNEKKLLTLSNCVNIFMTEFIPISISISTLLSEHALSDILKVEPDSSFIRLVSDSKELQETMRQKILQCKNLCICCCGYVYIPSFLTYAKHPTDSSLLVAKQPFSSDNDKLSCIKKTEVLKQLNSLRYYLEVLYEYHNN